MRARRCCWVSMRPWRCHTCRWTAAPEDSTPSCVPPAVPRPTETQLPRPSGHGAPDVTHHHRTQVCLPTSHAQSPAQRARDLWAMRTREPTRCRRQAQRPRRGYAWRSPWSAGVVWPFNVTTHLVLSTRTARGGALFARTRACPAPVPGSAARKNRAKIVKPALLVPIYAKAINHAV